MAVLVREGHYRCPDCHKTKPVKAYPQKYRWGHPPIPSALTCLACRKKDQKPCVPSFSDRLALAGVEANADPIESGYSGKLADHECRHGRLPGDRTPVCGCWEAERWAS